MRVYAILVAILLVGIPAFAMAQASTGDAEPTKDSGSTPSTHPDDSTDKIAFLKSVIQYSSQSHRRLEGSTDRADNREFHLKAQIAALPQPSQGVPDAKTLTKGMTKDQVIKLLEDKPDGDITDADNNEVMTWNWDLAHANVPKHIYIENQAWPYGHIVVCTFHHDILEYFTDDKPG